MEEQQLHLNIGLQKIRETVDQVEDLQKSLSIKRIELEEKNNAANAKLKQMVNHGYYNSCVTFVNIFQNQKIKIVVLNDWKSNSRMFYELYP